tara:strand:+ start:609 stop:839 length:231 start_codon:yes stop_codon:yes gene_type:complete
MKVKLIWKFYGNESVKTAKHHLVHLIEYSTKNNLDIFGDGIEKISENYSEAYIIVKKNNVDSLRKKLKPHKGVLLK